MSGENPRLLELRRRVQADPASIAFAQLAEECRRAGDTDEAVGIARAGLQYHPGYLSARVTLGRALIELDQLDEAEHELAYVLDSAPDNLAANRALAEVFQKRGQLPAALAQYRRALELARFDPEIEQQVNAIEAEIAPPERVKAEPTPAPAVEDLFDFDTLLQQLGGRSQPAQSPEAPPAAQPSTIAPSQVQSVTLVADESDPFSILERQLRETDQAPASAMPSAEELAAQRVLSELEDWLAAIAVHRDTQAEAR